MGCYQSIQYSCICEAKYNYYWTKYCSPLYTAVLLSPAQGTDWSLPHRADNADVHDTADEGTPGGDSAAGGEPWEQGCGEVRWGRREGGESQIGNRVVER